LLRLAAAGDPEAYEVAKALAETVLESPLVQMALWVQDDPTCLAQVIQLAVMLLDAPRPSKSKIG
jgi:hypothetical protein